ncbi:hypothetical protein EVAR_30822_1 [Eumeta japonica]|uniref:Mariner Mos1 transposase n=1 Tax=Eumeta variegata TaxID=151549 RepID=A0A4C1SH21_EUMVA|nr:hypothetical protein EVAR_30822_1 [Eumeta japonica]
MMLRFVDGNSNAVYDMATGDENWMCCYDPETKGQSARWVLPSEELSNEVKRGRRVRKKMMASHFRLTVHYATTVLVDKETVTADRHTNSYMPLVSEQVRET